MKTTKVLGIVLGTLLVAGLFVGAAAATDDVYLGDAYAWAAYPDNAFNNAGLATIKDNTTWTDASGNTVTFLKDDITNGAPGYYINGDDVVAAGDYAREFGGKKYHITVKMPSAAISGTVYKDNASVVKPKLIGALIGSTVMNDKYISISYPANATLAFTNPDGTITTIDPKQVDLNITQQENLKKADLGVWTVQAYYARDIKNPAGEDVKINGKLNISVFAPDFILGKPYYFTLVSSDTSKKLEANVDEVIEGNYATVTLTAPTGKWNVSLENGTIPGGQPLVVSGKLSINNLDSWTINVPADGVASFSVKPTDTADVKVKLLDNDDQKKTLKSITIKVKTGTITAEAEASTVIIGNEFDIDGTNDLGGELYFLIKGTNFPLSIVNDTANTPLTANGKVWDATIKTENLKKADDKKVDAGTYTIYVISKAGKTLGQIIENEDNLDKSEFVKAYTTISVALKQPFITITKAPEVLVQGEKLVVEGTAEGDPAEVQYYIFGTNYFNFGKASVTDGVYTVEVKKEDTKKEKMAAGQYFLVIQHMMYDKFFNIKADGANIVLTKDKNQLAKNQTLFNVNDRQSANAAQALCDALDSQDIDDMYAKASFVVAGPTSYIDAIPSQITKGQVLTISGTTTGHKDEVVSVELLSTAFAAIPKEAVGSASFVALTTKIGEDGVWSISFDTSNLNADEYTCSVAVGQLDATSSKITIVEGTNPQPTQTTTPVTPTAQPTAQPTQTPATPGFGALAALAGLGAVAVLLLRRQ